MTTEECALFSSAEQIARQKYDGHLTVMRFTTNWRVTFGTPYDRDDITKAHERATLADALEAASPQSADRE